MSNKKITGKQESAWLAAAMIVPLAQTASGCTWPAVLILGGACLLICWALGKYPVENPGWLLVLQRIWNCVVITEVLHWCVYCWPDAKSAYTIPLTLLLLAALAATDGVRAVRTGCVLLWPVAILLGAVLLSGIPEISLRNISPIWQVPSAHLITAALIPAMSAGEGRKGNSRLLWGAAIFALLTAVITTGVLTAVVVKGERAPIYELSRSLSLFGVGKRLESLIAAAMTMGYYVAVTYLICGGRIAEENPKPVWGMAALSGILICSGLRVDSRLLALGSVLIWVVLPLSTVIKKDFKKGKKGVDKRKPPC